MMLESAVPTQKGFTDTGNGFFPRFPFTNFYLVGGQKILYF